MSKQYSSDFKQLVLRLLRMNDVTTIHLLTRVPKRTLREWRQQQHLQQAQGKPAHNNP